MLAWTLGDWLLNFRAIVILAVAAALIFMERRAKASTSRAEPNLLPVVVWLTALPVVVLVALLGLPSPGQVLPLTMTMPDIVLMPVVGTIGLLRAFAIKVGANYHDTLYATAAICAALSIVGNLLWGVFLIA